MKTLTKFMRNMGIIVIVLLAVTIFNPLVVTKSNEYSLIIQFGKGGPGREFGRTIPQGSLPAVRAEDT